ALLDYTQPDRRTKPPGLGAQLKQNPEWESIPKRAWRRCIMKPPSEWKAGAFCHRPSEFPPSVPAEVYTSSAPTPRDAGREIPPRLLLPLPQTSPHRFLELRHWPWPTDRPREGSLVY